MTQAVRSEVRISIRHEGTTQPASWPDLGRLDWSEFGLVLGAGGVTGVAFQAGVLLGLEVDHGVSLASAGHLVGTSAGAVVAALVALGLDSSDLAALVSGTPQHFSERAAYLNATFVPDVFPEMPALVRMMRPQRPSDVVALTRLAAQRRYRAAMLRFLRDGPFDMHEHVSFLDGRDWPVTARLLICVTHLADGSRVVFDESAGVSLVDAVLASCAVPAVMRSVRIDDRAYVDGGLVSPTSAELLGGGGSHPSLVVVVSPMSGTASRTMQGRLSSRYATNRLRRELAAFGPEQTVVVIEPAGTLSQLVVDDSLGAGSTKRILGSAFTRVLC